MMDLSTVPKVELHCHLDGIIGPAMVRDICQDDPTYPLDPAVFVQAYPITDMESFFNCWNLISPIEGELAYFYPILGRYIEQLKTQQVLYAEVMIAAGELPPDRVEAIEKVTALREWVNQQEAGEIQVEFLVAFSRHRPPEAYAQLVEKILALYEAGFIMGVALAGPEIGNPVKPFENILARFREAGLGIEIHAGEWCGPESVWDALEYGYPDRIGHGVSLFQDAKLLEFVQERNIHIEMCPTSNLRTGSVARIGDHPVGKARALGLNFSINSDDPGPFECSMLSEYELLANVFGFSEYDFQTVFGNSLAARFQPELRHPALLNLEN